MEGKGNKKFAILVYKLPSNCHQDAMALLPNKDVEKITHDASGMKVFFKRWDNAWKCIHKQRTLQVRGNSYTISPLLTNLTLHGVREYASESNIRDLMTLYGPVLHLYPVELITRDGESVTWSMTNDYRVLLDVPEILSNFSLTPLRFGDHHIKVSFFCRLCRRDDHKQYQCLENTFRSEAPLRSLHFSSTVERSASCEIQPSPELPNQVWSSPEYNNESGMLGKKIQVKMERKVVKEEQDDFGHEGSDFRFGLSQAEMTNSCIKNNFTVKSELSQSGICDDSLIEKDHMVYAERQETLSPDRMAQDRKTSSYEAPWKEVAVDKPGQKKGNDNLASDSYEDSEEAHLVERGDRKSQRNKPKKGVSWRRLIPPHLDFVSTKGLLIDILAGQKLNSMSGEVDRWLHEVLYWNDARAEAETNQRFARWLRLYLDKIKKASKPEEVTCEPSAVEAVTKKASKKLKPTRRQNSFKLSPGIGKIVSKTTGILTAEQLQNFLEQVRGRKKQLEIAEIFTDNVPALIQQLKAVEKAYYIHGNRGKREDTDIAFIRGMSSRLEQKYEEKVEIEKSRLTVLSIPKTNISDECVVLEESVEKEAENSKKTSQPIFNTSILNEPKSSKNQIIKRKIKSSGNVARSINQPCKSKNFSEEYIVISERNVRQNAKSSKIYVPKNLQNLTEDNSEVCISPVTNNISVNRHQSSRIPNLILQPSRMKSSDPKSTPNFEKSSSFHVQFSGTQGRMRQSSVQLEYPENLKKSKRSSHFLRPSEQKLDNRKRLRSIDDSTENFRSHYLLNNIEYPSKFSEKHHNSIDNDFFCESDWNLQSSHSKASRPVETLSTYYNALDKSFTNCKGDFQNNHSVGAHLMESSYVRQPSNSGENLPSTKILKKILTCVSDIGKTSVESWRDIEKSGMNKEFTESFSGKFQTALDSPTANTLNVRPHSCYKEIPEVSSESLRKILLCAQQTLEKNC